MESGQIEVELTEVVETSSASSNLPFQQSKHVAAKEALRMQYRYLDLRNPDLQRNLITRSTITMKMREFLISKCFLDIETPTLFRRTPGGAKEFVVPTRLKGKFYSLVQSPQQFKQLLMVGGLDRYFQVARCYRDEGGKPDRQPEFTQLDMEMSFAGREDVVGVVEDLLASCWPEPVTLPVQRMTYQEAMGTYGVDKPDVRFANTIQNLGGSFQGCGFDVVEKMAAHEDCFIGGVFFEGTDAKCLKSVEKEVKTIFSDQIKVAKSNNQSLIISSLQSLDGQLSSGLLKKCSRNTSESLKASIGPDQLGFLVAGPKDLSVALLGRLRTLLAPLLLPDLPSRPHAFLWVQDFPLFLHEDGKLESAHHPFTAVHPEDRAKLLTEPLSCRSLHYDLVLDGQEVSNTGGGTRLTLFLQIGGGSVRIHSEEEQRYILCDVLGEKVGQHVLFCTFPLQADELEHLLTALGSGAPPHAGIALGLDRLFAILVRYSGSYF